MFPNNKKHPKHQDPSNLISQIRNVGTSLAARKMSIKKPGISICFCNANENVDTNSSKVLPNSFLMAGKWATSEGWKGRSASETCEKSKHCQFLSTIFNRKKYLRLDIWPKRDIDEIKGHEKHMAMVNNLYEGGRTLQR